MHAMPKVELQSSISETRNSVLRERAADTIGRVVDCLHATLPNLTADDLTILGAIGVGIGSAIAASRNPDDLQEYSRRTTLSLGITTASVATDALDGALARKIAAENPGKINPNGHILDAGSDRIQELMLSSHGQYPQENAMIRLENLQHSLRQSPHLYHLSPELFLNQKGMQFQKQEKVLSE